MIGSRTLKVWIMKYYGQHSASPGAPPSVPQAKPFLFLDSCELQSVSLKFVLKLALFYFSFISPPHLWLPHSGLSFMFVSAVLSRRLSVALPVADFLAVWFSIKRLRSPFSEMSPWLGPTVPFILLNKIKKGMQLHLVA